MANLFLAFEPLAGRRHVQVTERKTAKDFARFLRAVSDDLYLGAERIVLVLDNLNTHTPAALYEAFEPAEARRLAGRFEWHYTPKHGSWLNVAEMDLSVLARQCLDRRIPDWDTLRREVATWEAERNAAVVRVEWQFTTADARVKLKKLYPQSSCNEPLAEHMFDKGCHSATALEDKARKDARERIAERLYSESSNILGSGPDDDGPLELAASTLSNVADDLMFGVPPTAPKTTETGRHAPLSHLVLHRRGCPESHPVRAAPHPSAGGDQGQAGQVRHSVMDDRKRYSRTVWAVCSAAFFALIAARLVMRVVFGH